MPFLTYLKKLNQVRNLAKIKQEIKDCSEGENESKLFITVSCKIYTDCKELNTLDTLKFIWTKELEKINKRYVEKSYRVFNSLLKIIYPEESTYFSIIYDFVKIVKQRYGNFKLRSLIHFELPEPEEPEIKKSTINRDLVDFDDKKPGMIDGLYSNVLYEIKSKNITDGDDYCMNLESAFNLIEFIINNYKEYSRYLEQQHNNFKMSNVMIDILYHQALKYRSVIHFTFNVTDKERSLFIMFCENLSDRLLRLKE
jgi:hypothetical protein